MLRIVGFGVWERLGFRGLRVSFSLGVATQSPESKSPEAHERPDILNAAPNILEPFGPEA